MLDWWNRASLSLGDLLLGWSLRWSPSLTLVVVSVLSAAVLMLLRQWTTNQDQLHRATSDRRTLRRLIREAKRHGDLAAVVRYRGTMSLNRRIALKAEVLPLLFSILPIALLTTWSTLRLQYHPAQLGQPVKLTLYTPITAQDQLAHIVPIDGLQANGWVRRIDPLTGKVPARGRAVWKLVAGAEPTSPALTIRIGERSLTHNVLFGGTKYESPLRRHGDQLVTEVSLRKVKLFSLVPGIPQLQMPPWLVGYLLITVSAVFVLKRLLRLS